MYVDGLGKSWWWAGWRDGLAEVFEWRMKEVEAKRWQVETCSVWCKVSTVTLKRVGCRGDHGIVGHFMVTNVYCFLSLS